MLERNMKPGQEQQDLFREIRGRLLPHQSLVDEVAEVLHISIDSAYRRIRGEKPVSLEELVILSRHFQLSLDKILGLSSDGFIFSGHLKPADGDVFSAYLDNLLEYFNYFIGFENRHLFLLAKDLPLFLLFQVPELAAFKCYFWMKSILHDQRFRSQKFSLQEPLLQAYMPRAEKIAELSGRIPMTDIWNIESINSTMRQIQFYHEAGMFSNREEVHTLYQKILQLIDHVEKQAELGLKFAAGTEPGKNVMPYRLFINELILGDNTYLAELNGQVVTFLNHGVLYYIATRDERFNKAMYENLQHLMSKSTLISGVGEKERARFFNRLREKVETRLGQLK